MCLLLLVGDLPMQHQTTNCALKTQSLRTQTTNCHIYNHVHPYILILILPPLSIRQVLRFPPKHHHHHPLNTPSHHHTHIMRFLLSLLLLALLGCTAYGFVPHMPNKGQANKVIMPETHALAWCGQCLCVCALGPDVCGLSGLDTTSKVSKKKRTKSKIILIDTHTYIRT